MITGNINVDYLAGFATKYALRLNSIDNTVNMANDKIYVFHGSMDTVVNQGMFFVNLSFLLLFNFFYWFFTRMHKKSKSPIFQCFVIICFI